VVCNRTIGNGFKGISTGVILYVGDYIQTNTEPGKIGGGGEKGKKPNPKKKKFGS